MAVSLEVLKRILHQVVEAGPVELAAEEQRCLKVVAADPRMTTRFLLFCVAVDTENRLRLDQALAVIEAERIIEAGSDE